MGCRFNPEPHMLRFYPRVLHVMLQKADETFHQNCQSLWINDPWYPRIPPCILLCLSLGTSVLLLSRVSNWPNTVDYRSLFPGASLSLLLQVEAGFVPVTQSWRMTHLSSSQPHGFSFTTHFHKAFIYRHWWMEMGCTPRWGTQQTPQTSVGNMSLHQWGDLFLQNGTISKVLTRI